VKKERIVLILSVLLVTVTAGSLARSYRLQRDRQILEEELGELRKVALQSANKPADPLLPEVEDAIPPPQAPAAWAPVATLEVDAQDTKEESDNYRKEIEHLKLQLTQRDEKIAELKEQLKKSEDPGERRRRRREEREQYMERLKEEDPERYEELQKQRTDFRERLKANAGDQYAFLAEVNVSEWPEELQDNHAKVLRTVARIIEAIHQASTEGEAGRSNVGRQMFRQLRNSREMFAAEREMLLFDAAKQMGFDEDESWDFVDYIQTIQNVTSLRTLFRRRELLPQQPPAE